MASTDWSPPGGSWLTPGYRDRVTAPASAREAAIERLHQKRGFTQTVASYVIVNVFLWGLWFFTDDRSGFPWPAYVTIFSGLGLVFTWWRIYGQRPITEDEIRQEMARSGDVAPDA